MPAGCAKACDEMMRWAKLRNTSLGQPTCDVNTGGCVGLELSHWKSWRNSPPRKSEPGSCGNVTPWPWNHETGCSGVALRYGGSRTMAPECDLREVAWWQQNSSHPICTDRRIYLSLQFYPIPSNSIHLSIRLSTYPSIFESVCLLIFLSTGIYVFIYYQG